MLVVFANVLFSFKGWGNMNNNLAKIEVTELNPILKNSYIELFNFSETKKNMDEFMDQIEEWKYMCLNLQPPKITQSYEIRYESYVPMTSDKVGSFVQKKLDLEQRVNETYQLLTEALSRLNIRELDYFNMSYYHRLPDDIIGERIHVGETMVAHIKRSCIIKIALGLGKAVKNNSNK